MAVVLHVVRERNAPDQAAVAFEAVGRHVVRAAVVNLRQEAPFLHRFQRRQTTHGHGRAEAIFPHLLVQLFLPRIAWAERLAGPAERIDRRRAGAAGNHDIGPIPAGINHVFLSFLEIQRAIGPGGVVGRFDMAVGLAFVDVIDIKDDFGPVDMLGFLNIVNGRRENVGGALQLLVMRGGRALAVGSRPACACQHAEGDEEYGKVNSLFPQDVMIAGERGGDPLLDRKFHRGQQVAGGVLRFNFP